MRTTLDLPEDVSQTLRMESARRGGRRVAPLSRLVADAVRQTYGHTAKANRKRKIDLTPGRVVVGAANNAPEVTTETVRAALYD